MVDYKRLSFIFLFVIFFLLATETQMEKQIRVSLLSLFDIVVEESGAVSDTAPSSMLDTAENIRTGSYVFLNKQSVTLDKKVNSSQGLMSFAFGIGYYTVVFFKFISNYVITFYPFVVFLLYLFFTSRFFRKDEFGYDNF